MGWATLRAIYLQTHLVTLTGLPALQRGMQPTFSPHLRVNRYRCTFRPFKNDQTSKYIFSHWNRYDYVRCRPTKLSFFHTVISETVPRFFATGRSNASTWKPSFHIPTIYLEHITYP
jgi:hypothetical protein